MKPALAFLAFLCVATSPAAEPTNSAAATRTNAPSARRFGQASVISPEIHSDRRVTFRLRAPNAESVAVRGQWSTNQTSLNKGSNNVWSATLGPVDPGVYEYSLVVDGLSMIDPGNSAIKPMREPRTSILHLPGEPALWHDFRDVPHGTVHQHSYRSKALNRIRDLTIYTPPNYQARNRGTFPTLYLHHGAGDNNATWVAHGKAHWILDNLIAAGRVKPMVVVMMDGHAAVRGSGGTGLDSNTSAVERDLLEEVLPLVEKNYRVRKDAAGRGIVGLSMGGGQSLTIGLNHSDKFSWIGGFSSATPSADSVRKALDDRQINKKVKLLWIACGKDDFLLKRNEEFIALLNEHKVRHEWELTPGGHTWPVWREYLAEFAPQVF